LRKRFFRVIEEIAQKDRDIYILTADLGFKLFDDFRDKFPHRFFDVGVAEANMIGIASGLSLSGKKVYCYSIIPFLIMRPYEHIRMDIAYQNLNVKLIGVGGGVTYGLEGYSHFGLEDLALMRSLPNITIVVPSDPIEAEEIARISYNYPSPLYIRLGRTGEPIIHKEPPNFEVGKGMILKNGKDIAIFAIGNMVRVALGVYDILEKRGVSAFVVNMHTLKPLDKNIILECVSQHKAIFTIEDHFVSGGLGSAVSEVLLEYSYSGVFKRFGIPVKLKKSIGDANFLRNIYGLNADNISNSIFKIIEHNWK